MERLAPYGPFELDDIEDNDESRPPDFQEANARARIKYMPLDVWVDAMLKSNLQPTYFTWARQQAV